MKTTVSTLKKQKDNGEKITMLTCYDYSMAKLMDEAGIEILLIGDSLGNTMLGYENTLPVTMEDMIAHTAAVSRGAKNAFVLADMPFMSYQTSVYDAVMNRTSDERRTCTRCKTGRRRKSVPTDRSHRSSRYPGMCTYRTDTAVYQCFWRI